MDSRIEESVTQIAERLNEVDDEIDLASEEGASLEDIEGAKTLAAELIKKYDGLLKQIGPGEKARVQQTLGMGVERIKKRITQLKEAPE